MTLCRIHRISFLLVFLLLQSDCSKSPLRKQPAHKTRRECCFTLSPPLSPTSHVLLQVRCDLQRKAVPPIGHSPGLKCRSSSTLVRKGWSWSISSPVTSASSMLSDKVEPNSSGEGQLQRDVSEGGIEIVLFNTTSHSVRTLAELCCKSFYGIHPWYSSFFNPISGLQRVLLFEKVRDPSRREDEGNP